MSGLQTYVAIDEFSLNVSKNGDTKTLTIKPGDALGFDGINVFIGGEDQGTAAALRKVIGEWIEAYNGSEEFLKQIQDKIRGKSVKPQALRRVIVNSSLEHSSPDTDNDISRKQAPGKSEEFKKIVNEPEAEETTSSNIINDDQRVVAQVTTGDEQAEARSSSSVEISDASEERTLEIVSDETLVIKETSYDKEKTSDKKEEPKISIEEDAVVETTYNDPKKTDISSSTQAQIEETPAKAKDTKKKGPASKATKTLLDGLDTKEGRATDYSDQDGVVVKKGSVITVESDSDIASTFTIGSSDEGSEGTVTFSANNEISDGEVTFGSSGEDSPVDVSTDNAVIIDSGDSIDVQSLLDSL